MINWFISLFCKDAKTKIARKSYIEKTKHQEDNMSDNSIKINPIILNKYFMDLYDLTYISPEKKNISFLYDSTKKDLYIEYIGYKGTDYHQGQYFIHLNLPEDYPFSPPMIRVLTESGRFYPRSYLSLSISHYHKESWVIQNLEFLIVNIISAFTEDLTGIGHIYASSDERKDYAQNSRQYNQKYYPELYAKFEEIYKEKMKLSQLSKEESVEYVDKLKKSHI